MIRFSILFVLLIACTALAGQVLPRTTGYSAVALDERADSAYEAHNFRLAAGLYRSSAQRGLDINYYNEACSWALAGDEAKASIVLDHFLKLNEKHFQVSVQELRSDSDLDLLKKSGSLERLIATHFSKEEIQFEEKKVITYPELVSYIEIVGARGINHLEIQGKSIFWARKDGKFVSNYDSTGDLALQIRGMMFVEFPKLNLQFIDCEFHMNFIVDVPHEEPYLSRLGFLNCHFSGIVHLGQGAFGIYFRTRHLPEFEKCRFESVLGLSLQATGDDDYNSLRIDSCQLRESTSILLSPSHKPDIQLTRNTWLQDTSTLYISGLGVGSLVMRDNLFQNSHVTSISASAERLLVSNNSFGTFVLNGSVITDEISIRDSKISGKLLLRHSTFPAGPINSIDWKDIDHLRLGFYLKDSSIMSPSGVYNYFPQFVTGAKDSDIEDSRNYQDLMAVYSLFLELYKTRNDLESYNSCFITMKEIQTRRLEYLYQSDKSFEAFFRWKLSQLLKSYARYGTDPARAIVVSVYIILAFGVVFFFFPSDWDTTSKKRLLENFNDFRRKNAKGYVKPFFALLFGIFLSMLNAITLSLNAFVTLGFGNIPTHGLGRYFCVLEGFLGWFLLSIFTVALINQVI